MCKANSAATVREIVPEQRHVFSIGDEVFARVRGARPRYVLAVLACCGIMQLTFLSFGRPEVSRRRADPKVEALRAERSLNPRPEAVTDEAFASSEFLDPRDLVQVKYEMVRTVRVDGAPVARAAAAFGFSRPSYYGAAAALDAGGLAALVPARPGPRRAHKLTAEVVGFARARQEADPAVRAPDLARAIEERFGLHVHPRSVERALARESESKRGGAR